MTAPTTFGTYSPVLQAGDYFYISGQVGVDSTTKQAPKDISGQVQLALNNLFIVLQSVGLSKNDVVKSTVFLVNMNDFNVFNMLYGQFFGTHRPARSTVGVAALPKVASNTPVLIEIEAIAYKHTGGK